MLLKEADPIFSFNKAIIDATKDLATAYKINFAFYEALGSKGFESLEKTIDYIPKDLFSIADAKRSDIGNTSKMYAKSIFEHLNFDAVTLSPYMGRDAFDPFLSYKNKHVILLAHTSNNSSSEIQNQKLSNGAFVFEHVIEHYKNPSNTMFVVGATIPSSSQKKIRSICKESFLLVPGIGAQGGNLSDVLLHLAQPKPYVLINSSRQIIYASQKEDFTKAAHLEAEKLVKEMRTHINF